MERQLGTRLFERNSRSVSLTKAGSELVELARATVTSVDDIIRWAGGETGRRRFRVAVMAASPRVRSAIDATRAANPGIDWELQRAQFRGFREALRAEELDCAVVTELIDPVTDAELACHLLWTEPLVLVTRTDHRLAGQTPVSPAELSSEVLVCGPHGLQTREWFATLYELVPGHPQVHNSARDLDEAIELVSIGIGVNIASASVAQLYPRSELAFVPLTDVPDARAHLYCRRRDKSPVLSGLIRLAKG